MTAADTHDEVAQIPDRVAGMDGFRGLATLMVLVYHCWVQLKYPNLNVTGRKFIAGSYLSVDMFFVVSGFVIFLPMVRKNSPGNGKSYALRRFGRVAPAYYAALLIAIVGNQWLRVFTPDQSWFGLSGLAHLVMLQTPVLGNSPSLGFGAVGQVWTLSNETMFYVLLFFVATAFARRPLAGLGIATAVALLWRVALVNTVSDGHTETSLALQFPTYVLHFALGMVVAVIHVRQPLRARRQMQRVAPYLFALFAGLCIFLVFHAGDRGVRGMEGLADHQLRNLTFALCFALAMLFMVNGPDWIGRMVDVKPLRWVGEMSYGVYLTHLFFIGFALWAIGGPVTSTEPNSMFWALLGWTLVGSCLLAWLSFVALESPARARFRVLAERAKLKSERDRARVRAPVVRPVARPFPNAPRARSQS